MKVKLTGKGGVLLQLVEGVEIINVEFDQEEVQYLRVYSTDDKDHIIHSMETEDNQTLEDLVQVTVDVS